MGLTADGDICRPCKGPEDGAVDLLVGGSLMKQVGSASLVLDWVHRNDIINYNSLFSCLWCFTVVCLDCLVHVFC